MRISVSEWSVLKLALKLPRAMLDPELAIAAIRKHAYTRRGMAVYAVVLLAILVLMHWRTADPAVLRYTGLVSQLAGVKLIDARWDAAAVRVRSGTTAPGRTAVQDTDAARIQRALDGAAAGARTTALRTSIAELKKAFVEKADVVARFEKVAGDSRAALAAALRSDAAITTLVRDAWRDFPQRDRLVAAENLVVRVIAEAHQYHHAPNAAHRASLESYASELSRAQTLPKALQPAIVRLESDVHQLLLLKPLEQMLGERLASLNTAQRVDELADLYERELSGALARRDRWRIALAVYTAVLAFLLAYFGVRAITRYRDLEVLYAGQTRELAKALRRLKGHDEVQPKRDATAGSDEEAQVLSERHTQSFGTRKSV